MPTTPEPEWLTEAIDKARREGRVISETGVRSPAAGPGPTRRKREKVRLVMWSHVTEHDGTLTIIVPVHVVSEANQGGTFQASIGRKGRNKDAVFKALAPLWKKLGPFGDRYRAGRLLHVRISRIGGRTLDKANLPRALKAVEDALASWLGCNDGSPLWGVSWDQEPGPEYGVRITLSRSPL